MAQHHQKTSTNTLSEDFWANVVSANICEMDLLLAERSMARNITLESVRIGEVAVSRYQTESLSSANRNIEHIRRDCLDGFIITLPLTAEFRFSQRGIECRVQPGNFSLVATAHPFRITEGPTSARNKLISLHLVVPGPLLRAHCPNIDALCNRTIPIRPGAGHMMRSMVAAAVRDGALLSDSEAQSMSDLLVKLIADAATQDVEQSGDFRTSPARVQEMMLHRATSYIAANLSNPKLNSALVAKHCNVSVRYLQTVFAAASMSIAGSIRELRLQRCRDFLRNPSLQDRSVAEVATLWGFGNLSNFSRAYKARFCITPQQEKRS